MAQLTSIPHPDSFLAGVVASAGACAFVLPRPGSARLELRWATP